MTTTLTRIGLGIAAALVSVGVYAGAQDQNTNQPPPPFMGGRGHGGRGDSGRMGGPGGPGAMLPFLRELQLSDAQRDQVKRIADAHRDEFKALADRARAAHDGLMAAVSADAVNESVIRERSAEVAAVEADMAVARAHTRAEVTQILTADQKTRLKDLESRRPKRGPSGAPGRL